MMHFALACFCGFGLAFFVQYARHKNTIIMISAVRKRRDDDVPRATSKANLSAFLSAYLPIAYLPRTESLKGTSKLEIFTGLYQSSLKHGLQEHFWKRKQKRHQLLLEMQKRGGEGESLLAQLDDGGGESPANAKRKPGGVPKFERSSTLSLIKQFDKFNSDQL